MKTSESEIIITAALLGTERCQFTVDRPVMLAGGALQFHDKNKAAGYPLAEQIFEVEGVVSVQLEGSKVTVASEVGTNWREAGKGIGRVIREYLISEAANFEQTLAATEGSLDEKIRLKVQRVLDTQINPGVAGHGGKIKLLDVRGDAIYIQMGGGCQGCGQASVTLKQGVERALQQFVPEVKHVYDTTDHASGQNPYYSSSSSCK
ncbi:MAG: NifU family protein [Nitrospirota bacterium]